MATFIYFGFCLAMSKDFGQWYMENFAIAKKIYR